MNLFAQRRQAMGVAEHRVDPEIARVLALHRHPRTVVDPVPWRAGKALDLWPVQIEALSELKEYGGLLGPIGVGHGKTLIALLAGAVLGAEHAVVVVEPVTMGEFQRKLAELVERVHMPPTLIVSWGAWSTRANLLGTLPAGPGVLLVLDEAHKARNFSAARTGRVLEYAGRVGHAVALSGTLCDRGLEDFGHLAQATLEQRSPVPRGEAGRCLNRVLVGEPLLAGDRRTVEPLCTWAGIAVPRDEEGLRTAVRDAWRRRLQTAPGVTVSAGASCNASIYCQPYGKGLKLGNVLAKIDEVAKTFRGLDGFDYGTETDAARAAKQLALGYWLRWCWPNNKPDPQWLLARNGWAQAVRREIECNGRPGYDTEKSVRDAVTSRSPSLLLQALSRWQEAETRFRGKIHTDAVWETPIAMDLIASMALSGKHIVWYADQAVGEALKARGVRTIVAGDTVPMDGETMALSIHAHKLGLNLQAYNSMIFGCSPRSPATYEQAIGRVHRGGQREDEVWVRVPGWHAVLRRPLEAARAAAAFVAATGGDQKLALATFVE